MAIEQLTLFQKMYDFVLFLHPLASRFPKNQRFVLGQTLEKESLTMIMSTIQANKKTGQARKIIQDKISDKIDIIRVLLRLSCDLKFISIKQYGIAIVKLNEIGKIFNGWIKIV